MAPAGETCGSEQRQVTKAINDFCSRSGLSAGDGASCMAMLRLMFPRARITAVPTPGGCSATLLVDADTIVQFRAAAHALDLRVAAAARRIFGAGAPETRALPLTSPRLHAYAMTRIPGRSLRDDRARARTHASLRRRHRLCRDFADFLACAWRNTVAVKDWQPGRVGSSLAWRAAELSLRLPKRFSFVAEVIERNLQVIMGLPWVLTHGDLTADNIMVSESGKLAGMVDWAEAEVLPFGISLYGLEELLGQMTPGGFRYRPDADSLRESFWRKLLVEIPELADPEYHNAVALSRDFGVLLWHGFAWDDGAIDRVVQDSRDTEELLYLQAFLSEHCRHPSPML